MKNCKNCKKDKPLDEFYTHSGMRDGRLSKCKECCKIYEKATRREPSKSERIREYEKARNAEPKRREFHLLSQAKRRQEHPDKYKARTAVSNAIRDGRLQRGQCESTGCNRKPEAHHEDYSKPLEVRWVCKIHHELIHHPFTP